MGLIMSVVISAIMGVIAAFMVIRSNPEMTRLTPVPMIYLTNILMSVIVGVLVALCVPLGKLGRTLAIKANANPPGMKFTLINAIPLAVGNTLIVSLIVSLVGVITARTRIPPEALANVPPFFVMWLGNWGRLVLPTLVISYVIAVVLSPVVARIVGMPGKGPGGAPGKGPNNGKRP